jgi:hypothetical protein
MKDSPKVDCEFSGARLGARNDADVSHPAEIIICSGTGETEMISRYVEFACINHHTTFDRSICIDSILQFWYNR